LLTISHISKSFSGKSVLDDLSLEIRPGEFFSLLGPSGCGKTTLLRLIGGQERGDSGSISLNGRDLSALPPAQRPLHMIFQSLALFPHLDVGGNIAFGLKLRKVPAAEIRDRVARVLEQVELSGFERRQIATLSGGQKQRVAIARAVVNEPQLLLLDEPLSALDLKLRQKMQIELRQLQQKLAMTFIYVTHAQDEALSLSDRIAVMNQGRIEQTGTPEEIYQRPSTPFVASFVGTANMLSRSENGRERLLVVRPEHVRVLPEHPAPELPAGESEVLAVVTRTVFRGSHREVFVRLGEGRADSEWSAISEAVIPAGSPVRLRWSDRHSVLLDSRVPT
jgi:ABC-type Fe3+/spermidine/putrescine transport system ATPase subunit